ncbi:TetR/AcrR family transcriptional regulator [Aliiroseovarius sp. 2305UL8-7]|uniref:TetR/AcrR family transcriptional regulator n=1 Tax=Aliiroseovarius conchicola TaxID=3121637 RepID=UPI00352935E2
MKSETRVERQRQIESAAYYVLEKKGFSGASMLAIAKQAKASNETLYRWYSDKTGLFTALVERNAEDVKTMLAAQLDAEKQPLDILAQLGPKLLEVLVGDRAIALNRAAAADGTGVLGDAIAKSGRQSVAPLIAKTLERAKANGDLHFHDSNDAVELFLSLLVGDLQIRRAIGQLPQPTYKDVEKRASTALARFQALMGA